MSGTAFCLAVMHLTGVIYQAHADNIPREQMMEQVHHISNKELESRGELIVVTAYGGYTSVPAKDIALLAYTTCQTSHSRFSHPIEIDPWVW